MKGYLRRYQGLRSLLVLLLGYYLVHYRGDRFAHAFCSAQTTLYLNSEVCAQTVSKWARRRAGMPPARQV
jgi:hypothetical protein